MQFEDLEGRDWMSATLADADVLIQNMKWQDLALMDLLPHDLQARFPRLVHVRLIGSEFDPDRLAYDVVVQAESGFMSMNGHPDRLPARLPVALMDVLASTSHEGCRPRGIVPTRTNWARQLRRSQPARGRVDGTGKPSHQRPDQREGPQRQGSEHPNIAPYGDVLTHAVMDKLCLPWEAMPNSRTCAKR